MKQNNTPQQIIYSHRLANGTYQLDGTETIISESQFKKMQSLSPDGVFVIIADFGSPKTPGAIHIDFNLAK